METRKGEAYLRSRTEWEQIAYIAPDATGALETEVQQQLPADAASRRNRCWALFLIAQTMKNESFSERHGFRRTNETEITVRHDAPYELRGVLVDLAYECGYRPKGLRSLVCRVLRKRPDPNNWSEHPNVDGDLRQLLDDCDWYRVYDVAEARYESMSEAPISFDPEKFRDELNAYFVENGIGWQLNEGRIEVRGPEALQGAVETAKTTLELAGLRTAQQELHEALADLSRRPDADVSGAIQHSMAALECVVREVAGDPRATLGEIIN